MRRPLLARERRALAYAAAGLLLTCGSSACGRSADSADADTETHAIYPDALRVADLGPAYVPDPARTPPALASAGEPDRGGSTSVRRLRAEDLNFKRQGYFVRNRELGQVFTVPADLPPGTRVDAIVLRTGNSGSAVRAGAGGAEVYVQWFEVVGTPAVDDLGTGPGDSARHGYTANHRADDVVTGVRYVPLLTARGGRFPDLPPTSGTGGEAGHLRYLRFDLLGAGELSLKPGARYGFLVGFAEAGPERGFTLANRNLAAVPDAPAMMTGPDGAVRWGIRREGDGTTPPTLRAGYVPGTDTALDGRLRRESLHPSDYLTSVAPTSDGYPDVDTYRELEFYLEVREE